MFEFKEQKYENTKKPIFPKKDRDNYKNDIYILRVWQSDWDGHTRGFPSRDIAIRGSSNLDKLADMITASFEFELDHLYEFFDTIKQSKITEKYVMYFEDEPYNKNKSYTENIIVSQIFEKNKKMIFLFDYGDMWHFVIKCIEIREPKKDENRFPYGYNIKGKAFEQYPEYDE